MPTQHGPGESQAQSDRYEGDIAGGDFYRTSDLLSAVDRSLLRRVRTFMEAEVAPVITKYWTRAEFPFELIPGYAALGVAGAGYDGYGCAGRGAFLDGFVMLELARIDCSNRHLPRRAQWSGHGIDLSVRLR